MEIVSQSTTPKLFRKETRKKRTNIKQVDKSDECLVLPEMDDLFSDDKGAVRL